MNRNTDNGDLHSRNRPRDPLVAALRGLRQATRDYLVVAGAVLAALDVLEGRHEFVTLRTALAVACGRRGESFGTPVSIERMISGLLGEEPV